MIIYIDIGNTNIKMNFDDKYISFPTKVDYTVDSIFEKLPTELKNDKIEKVVLSSVVPSKQLLIEGLSKKYWNVTPIKIAYPIKTGITIKTDNPKEVGSDIVCLAAFAGTKSEESIIVNMGTATTISYVVKNELVGVVIVPGFVTSMESLVKNSAKISETDLYLPKNNYGKNTAESISVGMIKGNVHMIKGLVEDISKTADVYISGGNSKSVAKYLPEYNHIKEATIEGMKIIMERN